MTPGCVVCNQPVPPAVVGPKLTCSDACHEKFVAEMERVFGTHKRMVRTSSGEEFRVPLRDIIEVGVQERDLNHYPRWKETDE